MDLLSELTQLIGAAVIYFIPSFPETGKAEIVAEIVAKMVVERAVWYMLLTPAEPDIRASSINSENQYTNNVLETPLYCRRLI
ncbi:uncharacterized protein LAJ45_01669 [Morchella importuna]|uniref:uncharacterized protein n=1 Tax=Morchella importuna TaxID=1174673 RepID=UPI001E8E48E3|nr:uncharacterized protein LAJ45_01669 [Morchella importuna]KAH8153902.1 hypothetical protein LAJ45_01669 [Morchella importuna]